MSNSATLRIILAILMVMPTAVASAATAGSSVHAVTPSSVFAQIGFAENATHSYVIGVSWDWPWQRQWSAGKLSGFNEASFGKWVTNGASRGTAWATQVGITPVFRLRPQVWEGRWFIEAGIGINFILPLYQSRQKRFSTEFNFGDHLAVGRWFGATRHHELALRWQHFSNAGIDHPNPGENFIQLRYALRF